MSDTNEYECWHCGEEPVPLTEDGLCRECSDGKSPIVSNPCDTCRGTGWEEVPGEGAAIVCCVCLGSGRALLAS